MPAGITPGAAAKRSAAELGLDSSRAHAAKSCRLQRAPGAAHSQPDTAMQQPGNVSEHVGHAFSAARKQQDAAPPVAPSQVAAVPQSAAKTALVVCVPPCSAQPERACSTHAAGARANRTAPAALTSLSLASEATGCLPAHAPCTAHVQPDLVTASPTSSFASELDVPGGNVHATMATLADALLAPAAGAAQTRQALAASPSAPPGLGAHTRQQVEDAVHRPASIAAQAAGLQQGQRPSPSPCGARHQPVGAAPAKQAQHCARAAAVSEEAAHRPLLAHALRLLDSHPSGMEQHHTLPGDTPRASPARTAPPPSVKRRVEQHAWASTEHADASAHVACDPSTALGATRSGTCPAASATGTDPRIGPMQRAPNSADEVLDMWGASGRVALPQLTKVAFASTARHGPEATVARRVGRKGGWEKRRRPAADAQQQ